MFALQPSEKSLIRVFHAHRVGPFYNTAPYCSSVRHGKYARDIMKDVCCPNTILTLITPEISQL